MLKKNLNLYIFLCILAVFTIGYFIVINKTSYAFEYDEETYLYESKLNLIKLSAQKYAENNKSIFQDDDTVYVTVSDLISYGYLYSDDEDGNFFDPRSKVKTLNEYKIKISNEEDKINVKIIS